MTQIHHCTRSQDDMPFTVAALLLDGEDDFWLDASAESLLTVWDNTEDDRYTKLLKA